MAVIKQYVNLPGTTGNLGPTIRLQVTPNQIPNIHPGDQVDWWIEADPNNELLSWQSNSAAPPPGTLGRTQLSSPLPTVGVTEGTNHFFRNTLTLTQIGGDMYAVRASRVGQRANYARFPAAPDWIQTWRRLYYTVWYAGASTLGLFNNIEPRFVSEFRGHYIEMVRRGLNPTLNPAGDARLDAWSLPAQAGVGGLTHGDYPFMNGGPNALMSLQAWGSPPGAGTLSDKPLHMAFLLVPHCYDTWLKPRNYPTTRNVTGTVSTSDWVWRDPGLGGNFLYTGQASWPAAGATDVRSYFNTTAGLTAGFTNINWDLRPLPGLTAYLAASAANTFSLTFSYVSRRAINGYSWGNFCAVGCTGRTETAVLGTMAHEMGHGLNLAVRDEQQYNAATGVALGTVANPMWYSGNETGGQGLGGTGPHCHTNAGLTPDPTTPSGQRYDWWPALGPGLLCTIYHAGHSHRDDGHFCPTCAPIIRRRNLTRPTRGFGTWGDFG